MKAHNFLIIPVKFKTREMFTFRLYQQKQLSGNHHSAENVWHSVLWGICIWGICIFYTTDGQK